MLGRVGLIPVDGWYIFVPHTFFFQSFVPNTPVEDFLFSAHLYIIPLEIYDPFIRCAGRVFIGSYETAGVIPFWLYTECKRVRAHWQKQHDPLLDPRYANQLPRAG